jgi:DNA repair protein RadA/Sms
VKPVRLPKTLTPGGIRGSYRPSSGWLDSIDERAVGVDRGQLITPISAIDVTIADERIQVWSDEVNRVLGGGLVKGSVVLLAGEPGIGKSTILLQMASSIANVGGETSSVVYISGEENKAQVASRAHRLKLSLQNLFLLCDGDIDSALSEIDVMSPKPSVLIIDSVQTMYSSTCQGTVGSIIQVRDCTATLVRFAKSTGCSVILTGHVTKSGEVAGPRVLEHMVDTVLYLEGSERADYRLLRAMKNRFGSTFEMGVFSMEPLGLEDVSNPSELFMSQSVLSEGVEGAAVVITM